MKMVVNGTKRWWRDEKLWLIPFLAFLGADTVTGIIFRAKASSAAENNWTGKDQALYVQTVEANHLTMQKEITNAIKDALKDMTSQYKELDLAQHKHEQESHPSASQITEIQRSVENLGLRMNTVQQDVAALVAIAHRDSKIQGGRQ